MNKYILCVNAGSSSIKLAAVSYEAHRDASITYEADSVTDYSASLRQLLARLDSEHPHIRPHIIAVGHRIVHGGDQARVAHTIDDALISEIESYADFAPNHTPAALAIITALQEELPRATQVACFDTAFFHDLPLKAQTIALPRSYRDMGVRRYGFHGLSYEYLLKRLVKQTPRALTEKIIFAHLGSGASVAAVSHAKPVETTMGFTPTSGIIMSSRLGEVDPSLPVFLHERTGISFKEWERTINKESGLLGVSGLSGDMYALLQEEATNAHAKEAVELFVYRIQKAIGELSAAMGGVDRIVFAGGIGEKSSILRERIMSPLGYLGFSVDAARNTAVMSGVDKNDIHAIFTQDSKPIQVIHTDENESIAMHVRTIIQGAKGGQNDARN